MEGHAGKVMVGVAIVMLAFVGANVVDDYGLKTHESIFTADSDSDWNSGTLDSGIEVVNDSIQLNDTATGPASYVSADQDYNDTELGYMKVHSTVPDADNSTITVTVTVYDDTDTAIDSVTETVEGAEAVDISSLANKTSGDHYDVEVQLERDSTSITTPSMEDFSITEEQTNEGLQSLAVFVLIISAIAVAGSRFL